MALETLKGVEKIGGFEVKEVDWNHPEANFIEVNHIANAITFKIQNGPVKKNGVNGCQVDTLIATAARMISKLDEKFPCKENKDVLIHLTAALNRLEDRREDRESRGVDGTSQA
jgi:hypothetical protein